MKFIFKVLVLVSLIVLSKLIKEDENIMVAAKPPVPAQQQQAPDYENNPEEPKKLFPQASEVKVHKASLPFN